MTGIIVVTRSAAQIPAEQPAADASAVTDGSNGVIQDCRSEVAGQFEADPTGIADSAEAISPALAAAAQPEACTELNRAGQPCKGRPVRDGRCPAHKAR